MEITIHRGARQIGGSCLELKDGGSRLIFDVGLPLEKEGMDTADDLSVPGLLGDSGSASAPAAIFLSHAHADHSGLLSATCSTAPVWMSEGTSKMLLAGSLFAKQPGVPRARIRIFTPGEPVQVGQMKVTAYPVDHSIYDSMAFLVEGDGKRVLYTGDLRMHGRKAWMAERLKSACRVRPLDALIIEGTRLGARSSEENLSEEDLEEIILADLKTAEGLALALYSPLNVDRFVTFFRAAKQSGRTLVIDPYQAFVLHLLKARRTLPQPSDTGALRVLIPPHFAHSRAARRLRHTTWAQQLRHHAISVSEIQEDPAKHLLLFRASMQPWLFPDGFPERTLAFFSYWGGYLLEEPQQDLKVAIEAANGRLLHRHASGHAHPTDLVDFVHALSPKRLIPIHGESPEAWERHHPAAFPVTDGVPLHL